MTQHDESDVACMCGEPESTHDWGEPPHMFTPQGNEGAEVTYTTRVEWRVVGDPGGDYPTYRYTFADAAQARGFIALVTSTGNEWELGPFLERREVTETPWTRVTSPASTAQPTEENPK